MGRMGKEMEKGKGKGEMEKGEVGEVSGETEWRNGREVCIVKVVVFVVDVVAAGGRCDTCSDLRFFFVSAKLSRSIFNRWANSHPARTNWLRATAGSRLRGPSTAPRCGISGDTTRVAVLSRAVEVVAEKWGRMGGEGALASALMLIVSLLLVFTLVRRGFSRLAPASSAQPLQAHTNVYVDGIGHRCKCRSRRSRPADAREQGGRIPWGCHGPLRIRQYTTGNLG